MLRDNITDISFIEVSGKTTKYYNDNQRDLGSHLDVHTRFIDLDEDTAGVSTADVTMNLVATFQGKEVYLSEVTARVRIENLEDKHQDITSELIDLVWPIMATKLLDVAQAVGLSLTGLPMFKPEKSAQR
ncbi:hypothetical protein ACRQF6_04980 [Actinotignum sp. GS-2025f]|uniref:hypothetical protein n=1 Tax=unclassified Actinotignum TaxID=2632702 RepID=UPI002A7F8362|nr:hypothetical protein [Actinotignum sp. SLA_B059]MDY5127877.1 hypothetical protein [Actinotignum sp. SLA_B059]